jgi:hypothetical protein
MHMLKAVGCQGQRESCVYLSAMAVVLRYINSYLVRTLLSKIYDYISIGTALETIERPHARRFARLIPGMLRHLVRTGRWYCATSSTAWKRGRH